MPDDPQERDLGAVVRRGLAASGIEKSRQDFLKELADMEEGPGGDGVVATTLKYASAPLQWTAALAAKVLAPDYIARDFPFSVPERVSRQKTFSDLALELSGHSRGDILRDVGGTAAFGVGFGIDLIADPLNLLFKPYRVTHEAQAIKAAVLSTNAESIATALRTNITGQLQASLAGKAVLEIQDNLKNVRSVLAEGKDVLQVPKEILDGVAKGDPLSLKVREGIQRQNQLLKDMHSRGYLDSTEAVDIGRAALEEALGTRTVGPMERVRMGAGRILGSPAKAPGKLERKVASAVGVATWPLAKGRDALLKAMGQPGGTAALRFVLDQVPYQEHLDARAAAEGLGNLKRATSATLGRPATRDEMRSIIDLLENPLAEDPIRFANLQEMRAQLDTPTYEHLAPTAERAAPNVDGAYYAVQTLKKHEIDDVLRSGREEVRAGPGREYRVFPLPGADQPALVRQLYSDMRGRPGWGRVGIAKTAEGGSVAIVRRLLDSAVQPGAVTAQHIDSLQRVLALAAQKGWGVKPDAILEQAVSFQRLGTVQVVDPRVFVHYGTLKEALEANHLAGTQFLNRVAPRTPAPLDLLAAPELAAKVKPGSARRSLLQIRETMADRLSPELAKERAIWDRQSLVASIENQIAFPPDQVKGIADALAREGKIPPIQVAIDPQTGRMALADITSARILAAVEYLGHSHVPVQKVSWVGDAFAKATLAGDVKLEGRIVNQVFDSINEYAQTGSLPFQDAVESLRRYGIEDAALNHFNIGRLLDDEGNELLSASTLAAELQERGAKARKRLDAALAKAGVPNRERVLDSIFPLVGSGVDVDRKALLDLVQMLGDSPAGKAAKKLAGELGARVEAVNAFFGRGVGAYDPALLGAPRAWWVRAENGDTLIGHPLGALTPDYPAVGMAAVANSARNAKLTPLTRIQISPHVLDPGIVPGTGRSVFLRELSDTKAAYTRLAEEEFGAMLKEQRGRFLIDPERRRQLYDEGIEIAPKNSVWLTNRRIPDTEVNTFIRTPGGTLIIGHGIDNTKLLEDKVWGAIPHAIQEHGRIDQSGVVINNVQWSMMEALRQPQIDLLNERLQQIAQDFTRAGVPPQKHLRYSDNISMEWQLRENIFGKEPPTLGDVASGKYKVRIPDGWEGRQVEVASPLTGAVYTVRTASSAPLQEVLEIWRRDIQVNLSNEEIHARLSTPASYRYGYFARYMSPEGRAATEEFMAAVAKEQPNSSAGKVYSYTLDNLKGRSLTQLSTNEINDLFENGRVTLANGKPVQMEDLLKVKRKDGKTLQDLLSPEDLSYFVNDVYDSAMLRMLAGRRAIRHANLVDALKDFAHPILDGKKEIPLSRAREIIRKAREGVDLTTEERQVHDLLTKPGVYQATMTDAEARKLVAAGQLDSSWVEGVKRGDAMISIEGRFLDEPRWKDGNIRFMDREVIKEMNRTYQKLTSLPSVLKLLAGYHGLLSMWKRQALFLSPKFFTRNVVGDLLLAWQGGVSPTSPTYKEAYDVLRGFKQYTKFTEGTTEAGDWVLKAGGKADVGLSPKMTVTSKTGETRTYGELAEQALAHDVYRSPLVAEARKDLNDRLGIRGFQPLNSLHVDEGTKYTWGSAIEGLIEKGQRLHEGTENLFRFTVFLENWKNGSTVAEAAKIANKVMGNVTPLTPVERQLLAGVLPFYRWMRFNIPRQIMWHIEQPDKALRFWKAVQNISRGGADVPEDELPEWTKKNFGITLGKKDGKWGFFLIDSFLPAADALRVTQAFRDPGEAVSDVFATGLTPFLRMPLEAAMGQTVGGQQLETVPGELSNLAFGPVPLPGMTRAITNEGPLGPGNALWNEQVFNLFRPVKEVSQLLGLFHKPDQGIGERLRNFLLLKVTDSDPQTQLIIHNAHRQEIDKALRGRLRAAQREGNESKIKYWYSQINAHRIAQDDDD